MNRSGEDNPNETGEEFYGKYGYDNVHQFNIEEEYPTLIKRIVREERNGNYIIEDPELIGDITSFLSYMIEIGGKYINPNEITSIIVDERTGEQFNLESYAQYVDSHSVLSAVRTKKIISELGRKYIIAMAKVAAMRKGKADRLPFLFRVGRKLQFTKLHQEEMDYLETKIHNSIHRTAFLFNHYRVVEDGEVHMLVSGDNRSGKSGTSIRFLIYSWKDLNGYFRPIIEEQLAAGKYLKIDGTPYEKFEDLVPSKFRLKDRMIFLDRKGGLNLLASSPFPDLIYDEGNFTNINLKSMDPEAIDETITSFGARNKHPFVIYNYQNSNRPTLFLREKFNAWFHKIHIKHGFLLIRQRLVVPSKDPWLVKKLEKILETGNDDAIYSFFKNHPYTMREFKNMRDMPPKVRSRYELMKQEAQIEFYKNKNLSSQLEAAREEIAIQLAKQIKEGKILTASLDEKLLERGIRSISERSKIKSIINGLLTHQAILATLESKG